MVAAARPYVDQAAVIAIPTRAYLHPLTSLRFFAAAMLVIAHAGGWRDFPADFAHPLNLAAGVPFFFALSGFVLAYAYPTLDERGARAFFIARFARLWPTHAVTLVLGFVPLWLILGHFWGPTYTVPNLLANGVMIQSWLGIGGVAYAFNTPSWSISTEWGFYVVFPLLLMTWRRLWAVWLVGSVLLYWQIQQLARQFALPILDPTGRSLDIVGVMLVNPLTNLYLFVAGMAMCSVYRWLGPKARWGSIIGTVMEVVALALTAWTLTHPDSVASLLPAIKPVSRFITIPTMGVAFPFLILVMALGRGLVSRLLSLPLLVLGGEISYALYLVHIPIQNWLTYQFPGLASWPGPVSWVTLWTIDLLLAWLLWRFVERPARTSIRRWHDRSHAALSDRQWRLVCLGVVIMVAAIVGLAWASLQ